MNRVIVGQILLVVCCETYLLWWYRAFRPGTQVNRVGGLNAVLLAITACLGVGGVIMSLMPLPVKTPVRVHAATIVIGAGAAYMVLLVITNFVLNRVVTTELSLIVGWTALETAVITRLEAAGLLGQTNFLIMCVILAAAALISLILYVAYYRMKKMAAFRAAMVPLVTEAASMLVLIVMVLGAAGQ